MLSPDLREILEDRCLSSLFRAESVELGVVSRRTGERVRFRALDERRGVFGRLFGVALTRSSRPARGSSGSGLLVVVAAPAFLVLGFAAVVDAAPLSPMPSNWARSSSSVRAFSFAMAKMVIVSMVVCIEQQQYDEGRAPQLKVEHVPRRQHPLECTLTVFVESVT